MVDEEILSLLSQVPKKKYLKKLIDIAVCLNTQHNLLQPTFQNPITQNLQHDLQINK